MRKELPQGLSEMNCFEETPIWLGKGLNKKEERIYKYLHGYTDGYHHTAAEAALEFGSKVLRNKRKEISKIEKIEEKALKKLRLKKLNPRENQEINQEK
jgi:hypothetical protein